MNTARITQAAAEIERLTKARKWFQEYGLLLQHRDRDSFSISVRLAVASACPGAKEAEDQLTAAARVCIDVILAHAISDAENTIQICAEALREEIAKVATPCSPTLSGSWTVIQR